METFFKVIWGMAEVLDWHKVPPRSLWRFVLQKLDEKHGYQGMDMDY